MSGEEQALRRTLAAARIVERIGGPARLRDYRLATVAAESLVADGADPHDEATIARGVEDFGKRFGYLMAPAPSETERSRLEQLSPQARAAELKKAGVI